MRTLAAQRLQGYDNRVPAKSGAGFGNSNSQRRVAPDRAFFCALSNHLNGGLRGETSPSAGVLCDRLANPVHVRHPSFGNERGGFQDHKGIPL
jgi:hypothetical protein